ncbi:MAG TPA: hypothetical protein VKO38_04180, partial [Wenzhouxiangella sp.]|nr:hypothetical protein [Wenzhouxiangella sp.]
LRVNGEAVYGTRPWQRFGNLRGRELRYTDSDAALYAIVAGAVGDEFTIEHPGIDWSQIALLGASVKSVAEADGMLTLALAEPLAGPAAVVRFTR